MRKALTNEEATYLGLKLNKPQENRKKARYCINKVQWAKIVEFRNLGIVDSCNGFNVDVENVKHLWKKNGQSSVFVKNPMYKEPKVEELKNEIKNHQNP